jgi:hypothetical protein
MAKKTTTKPTTVTPPAAEPVGPPVTADLLAAIRKAADLDAAVRVLQPAAVRRNATYRLVEACTAPLPKARGACVRVFAAIVRRNAPFTPADIAADLPTLKSAAHWTRQLAKSGHIAEVQS